MDDGYQSVLQNRGMVDDRAQVQVLREGHGGRILMPGAVDSGEALEFEDEDFGCGSEAGELYVSCCLVTVGATSGRVDVVEISVGAVLEEMI